MRNIFVAVLAGILSAACLGQEGARAEVLITAEEAKLPASNDVALPTRGMTRGPGVELESPAQATSSPLPFKIKFEARNRIAIDPATVKLVYIKATPIDLTDRIKPFITADGITMNKAEAPPGLHLLRLDLKDVQGRVASAVFTLTVKDK
jgi:hypothetical protein